MASAFRARQYARAMVYLEREAKRAEARGDRERALALWATRDEIRFRRSVLIRELWAARRKDAVTP